MILAVGRAVRVRPGSVRQAFVAVVQVAVLAAVLGGALLARAAGGVGGLPVPAPAAISAAAAATTLATALADRGGLSFTVVQHTTVHAKPGGPLLDVADRADPRKVVGQTDSIDQAAFIERGGVSADGFWMELRDGPVGDAAPDFAGAEYRFGAIVKDGRTYRNDGAGWYVTDQPPGIGIDPATAALLPRLADSIKDATDLPALSSDGKTVRQLAAEASIADAPGLMAVDLAAASELTGPIDYGFDDAGRLVRLHAVIRDTTVEDWDFLVDVVITFGYGDAGPIPEPAPLVQPSAPKG
jgi:hypothetical protein